METWLVSDTPGRLHAAPFGSVLGKPPDFDRPYADPDDYLHGTNTDDLDGATIDQSCPGGDVKSGYSELVHPLQTGTAGARVPRFHVDDNTPDGSFELTVEWDVVLCGDQVTWGCMR